MTAPTAATSAPPAVTAADIDAAAERISAWITHPPLERSRRLTRITGAQIHLQREDMQHVRSYKGRGALNFLLQLPEDAQRAGIVCASAGNHAQGVARACYKLKIHGTVFLPRNTPRQKIERIRWLGGPQLDIEVTGSSYDEAQAAAMSFAEREGRVNVPPFDDPRVIAGQGTVAKDILASLGSEPAYVIVPVGGGGLLAGVATYLAEKSPATTVIGVEPAGAASMSAALAAGGPVTLSELDTFVDGAAVRRAGTLPFEIISGFGIDVRQVPEGRVCSEMLQLYQDEGIIAEPAGALAVAALGRPEGRAPVKVEAGASVVAIISGGNNDISRYSEVVERSLIYEGLRHYFIVDFPQEPGALRRFLDEVLGPDDDISLFEYVKRSNREYGPAFVGITLGHAADLDPLLARMDDSPLAIERVAPDSPLFRMFV